MSAQLKISGATEFKADLRAMPERLAGAGGAIVVRRAEAAAAKIRAGYPEITGNLRKGVKVDRVTVTREGATVRVRSTARHAWLYENGSNSERFYRGASRGWMPEVPQHVFVPVVVRERRAMTDDLIGLVRREGFTVTGRG